MLFNENIDISIRIGFVCMLVVIVLLIILIFSIKFRLDWLTQYVLYLHCRVDAIVKSDTSSDSTIPENNSDKMETKDE